MTLLCVGCYWADISAFTKNGCYGEPAGAGLRVISFAPVRRASRRSEVLY